MQKNLIAIAIGATIAAAPIVATQADVKLWGRAEVELVNLDGSGALGDRFNNDLQQGDTNGMSRFGVDASKDLGNGLKAVARFAWQLDPSNGADLRQRDQYVGLAGGWGAFIAGRLPTPYKMYGGVKWDPYTATFMQARRAGGMSGDALGHNSFVNDVLAYASPKMGGVKFTLAYVADETDTAPAPGDPDGPNAVGALNGTFTGGISGVFGPVEAIGAYTNANINGFDDITQWKVGIRYKGNGLTAAYQFEDVDSGGSIRANGNTLLRNAGEGKFNFINLGYKFGNTLIAGNYGNFSGDGTANSDVDVTNYSIGATYFFAKKVRTYVGYSAIKGTDVADDSAKVNMFGAGLRYDF